MSVTSTKGPEATNFIINRVVRAALLDRLQQTFEAFHDAAEISNAVYAEAMLGEVNALQYAIGRVETGEEIDWKAGTKFTQTMGMTVEFDDEELDDE